MKALLSTYDRTGLVAFARALHSRGFEIVSTGGTGAVLAGVGMPVQQVSELTGSPEILDGRVKTLHPVVHGGILARRDVPDHVAELNKHEIDTIDLVAVNLYPFVDTISRLGVTLEDALENIDIGGPTMVRAAAKNFPHVVIIVDPSDYGWIADRLLDAEVSKALSLEERRELARKAFQHVAAYDTAVSRYLENRDSGFHGELTLGYSKISDLRYGENPHQSAALYVDPLMDGGIGNAQQLHGPDLGFNNILDADAAWRIISDFDDQAVVVIKHNNPCGLAVHSDQETAYLRALEGDSVSAYGGIVGFNRPVNVVTAQAMRGAFYEVVVAPFYEPEALALLRKRNKLRVLQVASTGGQAGPEVRLISGGALFQTTDTIEEDPTAWKVVTERKPTEPELDNMAFAWKAAKHIKSNAIVLAKDSTMVGMGAGQPNRVASVHLAFRIAEDKASGSALASDAFFPFPDSIKLAAEGGVTAIIQPGGSIRDAEVIETANRLRVTMIFTNTRHFRH